MGDPKSANYVGRLEPLPLAGDQVNCTVKNEKYDEVHSNNIVSRHAEIDSSEKEQVVVVRGQPMDLQN